MTISVFCDCGFGHEAPEDQAGLSWTCPACGRTLTIPEAGPTEAIFYIGPNTGPTPTSKKGVWSFVIGMFVCFGCWSGIPAIVLGASALVDIHRSRGMLRGSMLASLGILAGMLGCYVTIPFVLERGGREAGRRAQCQNNLKNIGLGLMSEMVRRGGGEFPPAAITDKNGKPLLSWRVMILPDLDGQELYQQFHLDEPWDSPHNLTLLDQMPSILRCPDDPNRAPGMTNYQVIVGPNTLFTPDFKPLLIKDIVDGTSTTILVVESTRAVPWTKPDDLPFDSRRPLSEYANHHGLFNVVFADGHVQPLEEDLDPVIFNGLITRNGMKPLKAISTNGVVES